MADLGLVVLPAGIGVAHARKRILGGGVSKRVVDRAVDIEIGPPVDQAQVHIGGGGNAVMSTFTPSTQVLTNLAVRAYEAALNGASHWPWS